MQRPAEISVGSGAAPSVRSRTSGADSRDTSLPSVEEFLALAEDEKSTTAHNLSGYTVYHKYNKSC